VPVAFDAGKHAHQQTDCNLELHLCFFLECEGAKCGWCKCGIFVSDGRIEISTEENGEGYD
jgi:hypothetical protein